MADISVSFDEKDVKNNPANNKMDKKKNPFSKLSRKKLITVLILIVLLIIAVFAYQKYDELKKENQKLSNPQEAQRLETEILLERVAKHIEVPQGEQPTVATVVDASKLKNQAFFKNAQNGDKVLLFAQAKKAILYRPSTDKVVEVAPINIGESTKDKSDTSSDDSNTTNQSSSTEQSNTQPTQ